MSKSTAGGFLLLLPGVNAELIDARPGHIQLHNEAGPTPVVLSDGAYRVAEAFDGTRTAAAIYEGLRAGGVPVPNVDFVSALAQLLGKHGLAEVLEAPLAQPYTRVLSRQIESLYPLRHTCVGCGRSCEGHYIGPLQDEFLNTVDAIHEELSALYDDLVGVTPVERVSTDQGRERMVLARRDNRCIYLGVDGLCRIHKHLGAAAKPLVCRLFPLDTVQTETGIRVGVVGRCYELHRSFETAPASTPSELTGIPMEQFPAAEPRGADLRSRSRLLLNAGPGSIYASTQRLEQHLVEVLQDEGFGLRAGLEAFYATMRNPGLSDEPEDLMAGTGFGARVVELLQGFAVAMRAELEGQTILEGSHNARVVELCDFLSALEVRPLGELGEAERRYVSFVLSNEVFLRQWVNQPSLPTAFLVGLCGAMVARWRAEDAGESGETSVSEPFAYSMVAWVRTVRTGDNFVRFIGSEEVFQGLVDALGSPA